MNAPPPRPTGEDIGQMTGSEFCRAYLDRASREQMKSMLTFLAGYSPDGVAMAVSEYAPLALPCGAVAPHSGITCARPAGHDGIHESAHVPAIVWDAGGGEAVPRCPATSFGHRCERPSGHAMPHRTEGGTEWAGACPDRDCMLEEQHPGDHEYADPEDAAAVLAASTGAGTPVITDVEMCAEIHPGGNYMCELPKGHDGGHNAPSADDGSGDIAWDAAAQDDGEPGRTLHEQRLQAVREGSPAVQDGPYAYMRQDGYMAAEGASLRTAGGAA